MAMADFISSSKFVPVWDCHMQSRLARLIEITNAVRIPEKRQAVGPPSLQERVSQA
jgi:hypothetical protein